MRFAVGQNGSKWLVLGRQEDKISVPLGALQSGQFSAQPCLRIRFSETTPNGGLRPKNVPKMPCRPRCGPIMGLASGGLLHAAPEQGQSFIPVRNIPEYPEYPEYSGIFRNIPEYFTFFQNLAWKLPLDTLFLMLEQTRIFENTADLFRIFTVDLGRVCPGCR